ncbi:MAG: hypothetical protein AAGC44_01195 [Planctomycetota bacterium]
MPATPSDEELLKNAPQIPQADEELDELQAIDVEDELAPLEVEGLESHVPASSQTASKKITQFAQRVPHEDHWARQPNVTGKGAIHVKTFVAKLRLDAVEHLDQQVNEWLDAHPEYEVKFVNTTVGKLVGKNTEDALFMSVWV